VLEARQRFRRAPDWYFEWLQTTDRRYMEVGDHEVFVHPLTCSRKRQGLADWLDESRLPRLLKLRCGRHLEYSHACGIPEHDEAVSRLCNSKLREWWNSDAGYFAAIGLPSDVAMPLGSG